MDHLNKIVLKAFCYVTLGITFSGCAVYQIKKDVPLAMLDNATEHGRVGSATMLISTDDVEYLLSKNDIYVKYKVCMGFNDVCYYQFAGVTRNYEEMCAYQLPEHANCVKDFMRNLKIIKKMDLKKVKETAEDTMFYGMIHFSPPTITDYYEGRDDDLGFALAVSRVRGLSDFKIEYIDFTDRVAFENGAFERAEKLDTIAAYKAYLVDYPRSNKISMAKNKLFWKMFDVKLVSSEKTDQVSFQKSGFAASNAGSCQDYSKTFRINPKKDVNVDMDFDVSVKAVLNRRYSPINFGPETGPIEQIIPASLNKLNDYSFNYTALYQCVPTSVTISSALINGLAKLASMFGQKVGQTTYTLTLESTKFEVDIVGVK